MSRALAIIVHVVLGLFFWVAFATTVAFFSGGSWLAVLWIGSMLALWVVALVRMSSGPSPWKHTFLWWVVSFIAPIWALIELLQWRERAKRAVPAVHVSAPLRVERTEAEMDQEFFTRLDTLEGRLRALQSEIADLRAAATGAPAAASAPTAAPAPAPAAAAAPPLAVPATPSQAWFEPDDQPEVAPEPPQRPSAPPPFVPPPRGPSLADRLAAIDTSALLGARGLALAGGVVTLLGVVFFFVLAVNNGWIGPAARVSLGAVASLAVFGAGLFVRQRYGQLSSALAAVGAGIAGGYVTLLAATAMYDLVPKPVGLVLAAGIAAAGLAVALAWDAEVIGILGLIGAMAAPGLLALDSGLTSVGVAFVAFVFAALTFVAVRRAWQMLLWIGAGVALAQIGALVWATESPGAAVAALAIVFTALFLAGGIGWQLERHGPRTDSLTSTFVLGSAALVGLSGARILDSGAGRMTEQGLWLLAAAAVYGALAVVFFRGKQRDLATLLTAASLTLAGVAGADLLSGATLAVVWAFEAAALAWLAFRLREARFQLAGLLYLALAIGHTLAFDLPPTRFYVASRHPAEGILSLLASIAGAAAVAWWARPGAIDAPAEPRGGILAELDKLWRRLAAAQRDLRVSVASLSVVLAAGAISVGVLEVAEDTWRAGGTGAAFDRGHVVLTCVWAAVGLGVVLFGLRRRRPMLTDLALGWLAVVATKTVLFDATQVGRDRWPIAFAAVALSVLLAGYAFELLEARIARLSAVGPTAAVVAMLLACASILGMSEGWTDDQIGFAGLGVAVAYAALGSTLLRRRRGMATVLWGLALLLALPASALVIQDQWLVSAWAAAAAALAWLGHRLREERFELAAIGYVGLAFLGTLIVGAQPNDLVVSGSNPGAGLPSLAAVVGAMLAIAYVSSRRSYALWAAGGLIVYGFSLAILELAQHVGSASVSTSFQRGHTGVSALWGGLGLVLLIAGLKRDSRALRLGGLGLLAVSLAKLFLYDLATLSSVTRALSFLAVGAVLLLGAFFYQRAAQDERPRMS
jgi:uncharacterized membrane protein